MGLGGQNLLHLRLPIARLVLLCVSVALGCLDQVLADVAEEPWVSCAAAALENPTMVAHERAAKSGRGVLETREGLGVAAGVHLRLVVVGTLDLVVGKGLTT